MIILILTTNKFGIIKTNLNKVKWIRQESKIDLKY